MQSNTSVETRRDEKFSDGVNLTGNAVEIEDLQCKSSVKNENENKTTTSDEFRNEDLENLLLHYMKLTFKSREKNSEAVLRTFPADSGKDYSSISTDYDSDKDLLISKSSFTPPILKCKYCSKLLRGIPSLKNHCMRIHGDQSEKNILCDKCPTRFYTDFEFYRHYQTHDSDKNYLCHLCSKKFFQKYALEFHLRYHKNDRRYQCEICRKKFFTNSHLKRHSKTHTRRRDFKCEPCDRSFRCNDHLQKHIQRVHIGVRSHYCRECDKSFMYLSQLKLHEQSHKRPRKCELCKQRFRKEILFKIHQKQCRGVR